MKKVQIRQGDILFVKVKQTKDISNELSKGLRVASMIVAEGEATGHNHVVVGDKAVVVQNKWSLAPNWVVVQETAEVVHPEHDTVILEPGTYEIRRQREYTPERTVNVAD